jgi:hypothetical protein
MNDLPQSDDRSELYRALVVQHERREILKMRDRELMDMMQRQQLVELADAVATLHSEPAHVAPATTPAGDRKCGYINCSNIIPADANPSRKYCRESCAINHSAWLRRERSQQ